MAICPSICAGSGSRIRNVGMRIITRRELARFIKAVSNRFRCRKMNICGSYAGTWNAIRCGRAFSNGRNCGVGPACGIVVMTVARDCSMLGRSTCSGNGSVTAMEWRRRMYWKLCIPVSSADNRLAMKYGSRKWLANSDSNRRCVRAAVRGSERRRQRTVEKDSRPLFLSDLATVNVIVMFRLRFIVTQPASEVFCFDLRFSLHFVPTWFTIGPQQVARRPRLPRCPGAQSHRPLGF